MKTENIVETESSLQLMACDFERMFNCKLSTFVSDRINKYSLRYKDASPEERDYCIKKVISALLDQHLVRSGEHRLEQWEAGWSENLSKMANGAITEAVIPRYFSKHDFVRIEQKFIKPVVNDFEFNMLGAILDWLFDEYIRDANSIYEFGCGTGYHLLRVRDFNSTAKIWGLDWTSVSQKIISKLAMELDDQNMSGHRFNYFEPDRNFVLEKDAIVYTVASLEQVGTNYQEFLSYLLENNPRLCIHVEPIAELLNEDNLVDYLSIEYFKKRNYLSEFLPCLQKLEAEGKVKILRAQRTYAGSLFIEGHSVIVWTPQV